MMLETRLLQLIFIFSMLHHFKAQQQLTLGAAAAAASCQKTSLLIQTSWCALCVSSNSVGAANEDTDSVSYAGEWVSRVLIKGSANRGAINQARDHSYSHPTDRGSDVVFIQLLVQSLGRRFLLPTWLSKKLEEAGNQINVLQRCQFKHRL